MVFLIGNLNLINTICHIEFVLEKKQITTDISSLTVITYCYINSLY